MTGPAVAVVERARPTDADAIRRVVGLSPSTRRSLDRDLVATDRRCVVVRCDGEVVAFGCVVAGAGEAHLLDVAVTPTRRQRGVGSAIVARLRDLARDELAATAMTLEVRVGNAAARAMYRRLGFEEAGVRPGYYPDGGPDGAREDAVIMWDHDLSAVD